MKDQYARVFAVAMAFLFISPLELLFYNSP